MSVKATVLIPTTGDRGLLLPMSVGSALAQSVGDLEVFIIGDGVNQETREVIHELMRQDQRIRLFDHPKGVRRGELYRHVALQEARGHVICYLCDRDLWLYDHVETLCELLENTDFAHTLPIVIDPGIPPHHGIEIDLGKRLCRQTVVDRACPITLSSVGHTLDIYRRLPFGWRTTPHGKKTDHYMWQQFLVDPGCRAASGTIATLLYFNRGDYPGVPTLERQTELQSWNRRLASEVWQEEFRTSVQREMSKPRTRLYRTLRAFLWYRPRWTRILYGSPLKPLSHGVKRLLTRANS